MIVIFTTGNRPSQPGGVNLLIGDANHPGSAIGQLLTSGNLPDGINLVIGPNSGQPAFPGANGGPRKGKQIINNQITVLDSDGGCGGCAGEGAPQIINNQIIAFKAASSFTGGFAPFSSTSSGRRGSSTGQVLLAEILPLFVSTPKPQPAGTPSPPLLLAFLLLPSFSCPSLL
ncbi:Hypp577 [Branchiostoma lanceolatum]|uniref:Hypp577 protein n=1 Tax=Branchiostoma lanceolatum TaxID=7740 RepID=A0A8J9W0D7_BRALA|nr:Hypp577 [Branchiostoma lanceolatum]